MVIGSMLHRVRQAVQHNDPWSSELHLLEHAVVPIQRCLRQATEGASRLYDRLADEGDITIMAYLTMMTKGTQAR